MASHSSFWAHTPGPTGAWHPLDEHLKAVAADARRFAEAFGAGDLGYWIGLWHDVGKFSSGFQSYLQDCATRTEVRRHGPDHKGAGARLAADRAGAAALAIQAHHGGLQAPADFKQWLSERAKDPAVGEALSHARRAIPDLDPAQPLQPPAFAQRDPLKMELLLRFLLSVLVDADYLDTERHFAPDDSSRRVAAVSLADLWQRLERDQSTLTGHRSDSVGIARHDVYQACLRAAERHPGLFRLSVPTGGGKTRSAMAFALRHALKHGQRRVVVAVPFISITTQTADVYRGIFEQSDDASPVVLEHHSGLWTADDDSGDSTPRQVWSRLAAENWDAPIVVTTTVQLFESLFASSTSKVRKVHRLASSVIILDEVQSLPPHLLKPILDALQQLCAHYGTTVVLSTATQPAFEVIPEFRSMPATEIVPDAARLCGSLKRVKYEWRVDPPLDWPEVAALLRETPRGLAILNTKKDALALLDALGDGDALHLSTLLCGAHRRTVIEEVRRRLRDGLPCRLISTQVVEAGVDLDFPVVLRALGPLDAIVQAAGRCNREGRRERGRVIVFRPRDGGLPPGAYSIRTQTTETLLAGGNLDPDDPALVREYFCHFLSLLAGAGLDRDDIQKARMALDFPRVARCFRLIDDETESVVITTYGPADERNRVQQLLDALRRGPANSRALLRRLQPYLVSVRRRDAEEFRRRGLILPLQDGLGEWLGGYDPVRGMSGDANALERLVV